MSKIKDFDTEDAEKLCDVGKALSVPIRIEILKLLYQNSLIIGEIARILGIPQSSAAFHLKLLEKAELIRMEEQPGTRGIKKLCSRRYDRLYIDLVKPQGNINAVLSIEMPVGAYTSFSFIPTCGLCSSESVIGMEDMEYSFYLPERFQAQLLWASAGFVEYKFPNPVPAKKKPKRLNLSLEICSEAPGYKENWKSEITVWINGVDCGTWLSPGDFGSHRGFLTPLFWPDGSSQYGILKNWEVSQTGCFIGEEHVSSITINDLDIMTTPFISVKIGNKENAAFRGGFNIFGKAFGNHAQDIFLSLEY